MALTLGFLILYTLPTWKLLSPVQLQTSLEVQYFFLQFRMMLKETSFYIILRGFIRKCSECRRSHSSPSDIITCRSKKKYCPLSWKILTEDEFSRESAEILKKSILRRQVWKSYIFKINKKLLSAEKGKINQSLPIFLLLLIEEHCLPFLWLL